MKKIRLGVLGGYRGRSMIRFGHLMTGQDVELVAVCDKLPEVLERQRKMCGDSVAYYADFNDFIKHDMDAVVLANYATEHAPFAIRCMKAGKHVLSEVLPVQTMKEAVELIECVEETGMTYCYGENYCYMPGPAEMKRLYRAGKIGEFEYGEGEYIHNCEPIWHEITYGDPNHWRNNSFVTYYCTHSLGPIIHATGLRPVKVTGFESKQNKRRLRVGCKSGEYAIEMVELENGGMIRSVHGGLYKDSIWYSMYGSKGRMETYRDDMMDIGVRRILVNSDEEEFAYDTEKREDYIPKRPFDVISEDFGHAGSDFYTMYNFIRKLQGRKEADVIDVYEAMDMALPGLFAYRSVLKGGIPMEIPNLRNKTEREKYRNDTMCTDPKVAGDMLIPSYSEGNPEIPDEVYERMRKLWEIKRQQINNE